MNYVQISGFYITPILVSYNKIQIVIKQNFDYTHQLLTLHVVNMCAHVCACVQINGLLCLLLAVRIPQDTDSFAHLKMRCTKLI